MQKLILPIPALVLTAGYQNTAYRNRFGFPHFGHDAISLKAERRVFACGEGKVLATGLDSLLGNVVIVHYPMAYIRSKKNYADVVLRHYHLDSIAVKVGDVVKAGSLLGIYGNTGRYSAGAHLHTEVDTDIAYFAYSATVGKSGTVIKAGTVESMLCPSEVLHIGLGQTFQPSKGGFRGVDYVLAGDYYQPI